MKGLTVAVREFPEEDHGSGWYCRLPVAVFATRWKHPEQTGFTDRPTVGGIVPSPVVPGERVGTKSQRRHPRLPS